MEYKSKSTTFRRLLWNTLWNNRVIGIIMLLMLTLIFLNEFLSIRLKVYSAVLITTIAKQKKPQGDLIEDFYMFGTIIFVHYALSSLIHYLKRILDTVLFVVALRDAEEETLQLEYGEYHRRGLGKNQDNIVRSSWSFADAAITILADIPECLIGLAMSSIEFYNLFPSEVRGIFFGILFCCVLFALWIGVIVNRNERVCTRMYRNTYVYLVDTLTNFDVVKAFNKEDKEVEQYSKALSGYSRRTQSYFTLRYLLSFAQKCSMILPHFAIVYLFIRGRIALTEAQLIYCNTLYMGYKKNFIALRDRCFSVSKRVAEVEPRMRVQYKDESKSVPVDGFSHSLELRNVDLYAGGNLINRNISFRILRGEKVAITGLNGTGKSTFLKAVLRFHTHRGSILIDDKPIDGLRDCSVRNLLGYVPQDHHIFNNTVMYNLSYGQEKFDEQEVYRLCKQYGYHEFFSGLPNGYFTHAGENGKNLSGGQKQRVNFMRAIIRGAPILILDEPTANLDKAAEREMLNSIFTHCQDKTVLMIIHNLDLLDGFDKILYFKNGGVDVYHSPEEFRAK